MRSNAKYSLRKVRGRRGKGSKKKKKVCCFNCKHSYALKCFPSYHEMDCVAITMPLSVKRNQILTLGQS